MTDYLRIEACATQTEFVTPNENSAHFLGLIRLSLILARSRSGAMAGILPGAGRQNNPKLPFCLITPAPPRYFPRW